MDTLKELRSKIDKIDHQLVELLDKRASLAKSIGKRKMADGVSFFDPSRQKSIIDKVLKLSNGSFPTEELKMVFTEIMSTCLNLEKKLSIGFLGPEATFTHLAAVNEFGSACDLVSYNSIYDIFLAVANDWVNFGVVPIENSTGGIVHDTLDRFLEFEVRITSEIIIYIRHNLLSKYSLKQVKKVYSKDQALRQCSIWLRENLPQAELVESPTTTQGVLLAKQQSNAAAIGTELASRMYGLPIVARSIEDSKDNYTRFLVIGKIAPPHSGKDKTSIMFSLKNKPGALHSALKPFAEEGINLSKIESRPTRQRAWEYVFFVDLDGHILDDKVKRTLRKVARHATFLTVLGSYPRARVYK